MELKREMHAYWSEREKHYILIKRIENNLRFAKGNLADHKRDEAPYLESKKNSVRAAENTLKAIMARPEMMRRAETARLAKEEKSKKLKKQMMSAWVDHVVLIEDFKDMTMDQKKTEKKRFDALYMEIKCRK